MKKGMIVAFAIVILSSISVLIGRSFRVSKVPHGNKFSCNTCHTNGGGTPRNPFGLAVEARVTPNGTESFWGSDLAALDSDGDGFSNGIELQDPTGSWIEGTSLPGDVAQVTNPGDPTSHPPITSVADNSIPNDYALEQNYPNPFNPTTKITFSVPVASNVVLNIFNSNGELIKELINESFGQGRYTLLWNGRNSLGQLVSSGVYFYQLAADNFVETKRMIMLK